MKDGQLFTGRGQAVFDVTTYIGDFVEGKRHGAGISMGMSGFIYEGEWQHNKREGQGIIRDLPGIITSQGLFKDNKLTHTQSQNVPAVPSVPSPPSSEALQVRSD